MFERQKGIVNMWELIIYIYISFFLLGIALSTLIIRLRIFKDRRKKKVFYTKKEEINIPSKSQLFIKVKYLLEGYLRYILLWTGKIPSHKIRKFMMKKLFCANIQKNAIIYGGAEIRSPEKLFIGEGSIIGDEAKLDARNGIVIGKNVNFSTGVWIWTEQHDVNSSIFSESEKLEKCVVIEDRVWLGSRVTVLPGVTIGEGAVVASGAVVTKNLKSYGVYAGIPAKFISERNKNLTYVFNGDHYSFW